MRRVISHAAARLPAGTSDAGNWPANLIHDGARWCEAVSATLESPNSFQPAPSTVRQGEQDRGRDVGWSTWQPFTGRTAKV